MDKDLITNYNHTITMNERKNINISGVKKIDSFDNEEFLLETTMGYIIIKGETLEIIKLDTYQGNVSIKGKINSLVYMENSGKKKKKKEFLVSYLNNGYTYSNKNIINFFCIWSFLFFFSWAKL